MADLIKFLIICLNCAIFSGSASYAIDHTPDVNIVTVEVFELGISDAGDSAYVMVKADAHSGLGVWNRSSRAIEVYFPDQSMWLRWELIAGTKTQFTSSKWTRPRELSEHPLIIENTSGSDDYIFPLQEKTLKLKLLDYSLKSDIQIYLTESAGFGFGDDITWSFGGSQVASKTLKEAVPGPQLGLEDPCLQIISFPIVGMTKDSSGQSVSKTASLLYQGNAVLRKEIRLIPDLKEIEFSHYDGDDYADARLPAGSEISIFQYLGGAGDFVLFFTITTDDMEKLGKLGSFTLAANYWTSSELQFSGAEKIASDHVLMSPPEYFGVKCDHLYIKREKGIAISKLDKINRSLLADDVYFPSSPESEDRISEKVPRPVSEETGGKIGSIIVKNDMAKSLERGIPEPQPEPEPTIIPPALPVKAKPDRKVESQGLSDHCVLTEEDRRRWRVPAYINAKIKSTKLLAGLKTDGVNAFEIFETINGNSIGAKESSFADELIEVGGSILTDFGTMHRLSLDAMRAGFGTLDETGYRIMIIGTPLALFSSGLEDIMAEYAKLPFPIEFDWMEQQMDGKVSPPRRIDLDELNKLSLSSSDVTIEFGEAPLLNNQNYKPIMEAIQDTFVKYGGANQIFVVKTNWQQPGDARAQLQQAVNEIESRLGRESLSSDWLIVLSNYGINLGAGDDFTSVLSGNSRGFYRGGFKLDNKFNKEICKKALCNPARLATALTNKAKAVMKKVSGRTVEIIGFSPTLLRELTIVAPPAAIGAYFNMFAEMATAPEKSISDIFPEATMRIIFNNFTSKDLLNSRNELAQSKIDDVKKTTQTLSSALPSGRSGTQCSFVSLTYD